MGQIIKKVLLMLLLIILLIVLSDFVSMSYQDRLATLMIMLSSLIVYNERYENLGNIHGGIFDESIRYNA